MVRYVIVSLPRSGSFLSCQLLDEYLTKKYAGYLASPFYEWFCRGNINRTVNLALAYSPASGITLNKKCGSVCFNHEIFRRLSLLDRLKENDQWTVFKLMVDVTPMHAIKHFLNADGYHIIFLERENIVDLILSRVIAARTRHWHTSKNDNDQGEAIKRNSYTALLGRQASYKAPVKKPIIDKYLDAIDTYKALIAERQYRFPSHTSVIRYEAVNECLSSFYEPLCLHDWNEYISDFSFLQTLPNERAMPLTTWVSNLDEVLAWIAARHGSAYSETTQSVSATGSISLDSSGIDIHLDDSKQTISDAWAKNA